MGTVTEHNVAKIAGCFSGIDWSLKSFCVNCRKIAGMVHMRMRQKNKIQISRRHRNTDWTEKEYLDEIYRFTDEKLRSVPSKDDPNAEFDIAFLNRAALERHGYDTATITDSDLQELAGRMGDYYCESSKFSEDLRTACGDFGLKLRDTTNPK